MNERFKIANRVERALGVTYHDPEHPWLTSQRTLRKLIGILGISLPFILIGFVWITSGWFGTLDSISHYYFTRASPVFTGVVSLMAIFLLIYKGYDKLDFYSSTAAAIGALTLVILPTDNVGHIPAPNVVVTTLPTDAPLRVGLHYGGAGLFLFTLACMSIFLFTLGETKPRPRARKIQNGFHRGLGFFMFVALVLIGLRALGRGIPADIYDKYHLTFWLETVAVVSFGASWLIKGAASSSSQSTESELEAVAEDELAG